MYNNLEIENRNRKILNLKIFKMSKYVLLLICHVMYKKYKYLFVK